jgi:hypothetical protein
MNARLVEWQTKVLSSFVGAAGMVEAQNGKNPLVEAAREIDIFAGSSPEHLARERELDELRGEVVAADWRDDPRLQKPVAADPERGIEAANADGSFESFMRAFDPGGAHLAAVPDLPAEDGGDVPLLLRA